MIIKFKRLHEDAQLPIKKKGDAGLDLSCVRDETFTNGIYSFINDSSTDKLYRVLYSGQRHLFHTGLLCEMPEGYCMILHDRSGLSSKFGLQKIGGVIDNSYRGEILVCLINTGKTPVKIYEKQRIIQGIIQADIDCNTEWATELTTTTRGEKGFGSSG